MKVLVKCLYICIFLRVHEGVRCVLYLCVCVLAVTVYCACVCAVNVASFECLNRNANRKQQQKRKNWFTYDSQNALVLVSVWLCVLSVCVCGCCVCVCLVRLPFVCLFLCWQEKHFPQIIDYQNYIKNATKKRGTEKEKGPWARQGIPYISYGNKLFPTELSSHLPRLPSPPPRAPSTAIRQNWL